MEAPLEVRYAGVIIGRAPEVRGANGESTFFLPGKEPMPVGTVVRLRSGDRETPARVLRAVESADPAVAGMQVRLIGEAEEVAADWIPTPAPAAVKARPGTPTPAVEVDLELLRSEAVKTPVVQVQGSAAIPEAVPVAIGSSLTGALEKAAETAAEPPAPAVAASEEPPGAPVAAVTGDLDIIITDTPPPVTVNAPEAPAPAPAAAEPAAASEATTTASAEAAAEATNGASANSAEGAANGDDDAGEAAGAAPTGDNMPAARPIAAPSGRRKTKRRRYQRA